MALIAVGLSHRCPIELSNEKGRGGRRRRRRRRRRGRRRRRSKRFGKGGRKGKRRNVEFEQCERDGWEEEGGKVDR